jgi:CarboxypepD_reg-like domain
MIYLTTQSFKTQSNLPNFDANTSIMKAILPVLICFLSFITSAEAQIVAHVKGQVIDAQTGELLPFVTVFIQKLGIGCNTDENGQFELKITANGSQNLTIRLVGYKQQDILITPKTNEIININIKLSAENPLPDPNLIREKPQNVPPVLACDDKATIQFEMYIENLKDSTYVLSWTELEGSGCEYFCLVTDGQNRLGEYPGLSTPMSFCYFRPTTDSIEVYLKKGGNMITYSSDDNKDSCLCTYKKIKLPVKNQGSFTVKIAADPNTTYFPLLNDRYQFTSYYHPINSQFYYLDEDSGKIRSGSHWARTYSTERFTMKKRYRIDPTRIYTDRSGKKFTGQDLIKLKKIDLDQFYDASSFYEDGDFWTY